MLVASDVMDLHLDESMQRGAEESGTHCIVFFLKMLIGGLFEMNIKAYYF